MIITWDSAYEAAPPDTLRIGLIDNVIRDVSFAIRERMSIEHEWGPSSSKNDGSHILGGTTVLATGNLAAMNAISNMQEGSLFLLNTGADLNLMIYFNGAWEALSTVDHATLTGTTDDDHPQYLLKDGGIMGAALNMNNHMVIAPVVAESYSGMVLKYHTTRPHTLLGDLKAITANTITAAKLPLSRSVTDTNIGPNTIYQWYVFDKEFFPAVYQLQERDVYFAVGGTVDGVLGLWNTDFFSGVDIKIEREWIDD